MATYEEIYGKRVKEFDSDPTLDSTYEGQVWYNTGDGVLKSVVNFSAFISGGTLNTTRSQIAGAGTKTAGLAIGGTPSSTTTPSRTNGNKTESYNGLAYTNEANCPLYKRQASGLGTQTAALFLGGYDEPQGYEATSAEFDGSSWTSGGSYPGDISNQGGGAGTQTAGWNAGGYTGPSGVTNGTYNYNGSSWTSSGNLPYSAQNVTNLGPQTAGMAAGGNKDPGISTDWSFYDGSSWTAQTAISAPVQSNARAGTQSNAILFGGYITTAYVATCLEWDGSAWATNPASLATRRGNGASCGVSTSINDGFMSGGDLSETTVYSATEEFDKSINTITKGAWASGGAMNTARSQGTGAGTMTAGWIVGGSEPSLSNKTEEYNGTSWTAVNNLGMSSRLLAGAGPQTSAFATGGFTGPSTVVATVYDYDGTDWTAGAAQPVATYGQGSFGTQTAGVVCGGSSPTASNYQTTSFEYDGEGWTASPGSMNQGRHYIAGSGTQTAGLIAGGDKGSPGKSDNTEEYNGSTWTNGATTPDVRRGAGLSGPQTAALYFGGSGDPGARTTTFAYDGTSWSNMPSIATSRRLIAGGSKDGTTSSAWMAGGQLESPDARSALTEEFTGNTETVASRTLTTS